MVLIVEPEESPNGISYYIQRLWRSINCLLKSPRGNPLDLFNRILLSFFIFILLMGLIIFVSIILLNSWGCITEKGTIIQPFEIDSRIHQNISGEALANSLCFELSHIKTFRLLSQEESLAPSAFNQLPPYSFFPPTNSLERPSIVFNQNADNNIVTLNEKSQFDDQNNYDVGKIDMGGVSLSLGVIIPFLKELTQNQGNIITGSLQQHGSTLRIVATYYNPDLKGQNRAWEESRIVLLENESTVDEAIPAMIENLSYKIELSFSKDKPNDNPQTWQAFKYLILGWEACQLYNATRDIEYLERARRMALSAKSSEPYYQGSEKLLSYIESIWNRKGIILYNKGDYNAALQCYDKAIEIDNMVSEINQRAEST